MAKSKYNKKELMEQIQILLNEEKESCKQLSENNNPQVLEMYNIALGRIDALEDILILGNKKEVK